MITPASCSVDKPGELSTTETPSTVVVTGSARGRVGVWVVLF